MTLDWSATARRQVRVKLARRRPGEPEQVVRARAPAPAPIPKPSKLGAGVAPLFPEVARQLAHHQPGRDVSPLQRTGGGARGLTRERESCRDGQP